MLHLITFNDTLTLGGAPLDEGSARRRGLYLYSTRHSQETNIDWDSKQQSQQASRRRPMPDPAWPPKLAHA